CRHPQSLHALGHAHDRSGDHAVNPSGVWGTTRSIDLCNKAIAETRWLLKHRTKQLKNAI
ncbi:hypothetical protein, partial [Massilia sp.]|uniref:hypothetical protein n=1 Tax=Massilia sp. TaxID=1882437 RepID=UPI00391DCB5B